MRWFKIVFFIIITCSETFAKKIKIIRNDNGNTTLIFQDDRSLNTDGIVIFSPDSQVCAIYNPQYCKYVCNFEVYDARGIKINNDSLFGKSISLADDGRFVIYNPIFYNMTVYENTLHLYNKLSKEVSINYIFNDHLVANFFNNGMLLVIHNQTTDWRVRPNYIYAAILLDSNYSIISKSNSFYFSPFISSIKLLNDSLIEIIENLGESFKTRIYNTNLEDITDKIRIK